MSLSSLIALTSINIFAISDQAVFRLSESVYMISDIPPYLNALGTIRCFKGKSLLLNSFGLNKTLPSYHQLKKSLVKNEKFLLKLLKMIKVEKFTNNKKIDLSLEELKPLHIGKCANNNWKKWPVRLKSLLHTEFYLRKRYEDQSQLNLFLDTIDKKYDHNLFF